MNRIAMQLVAAGALAWAAAAPAEVVFEEDFNYAGDVDTQEIHGQTGGTGFTTAWNAPATITQLTSQSLSYQVQGGGVIEGGSGALQLGTGSSSPNHGAIISRNISSFNGNEVFVRFLIRQTAGSRDNGDSVYLWLNTNIGPTLAWIPLGSDNNDFFLRTSTAGSTGSGGVDAVTGTTYLVVARFFKTAGPGDGYDSAQLWVNPAYGDLGAPDVNLGPSISVNNLTSITAIGIQTFQLEDDDVFIVDAIKAGTAWFEVVPAVPEPGTLSLLALGLGAVFRRRSR